MSPSFEAVGGPAWRVSELTGDMVHTASEQWRHECECRWILDDMASREQRNAYLDGEYDHANKLVRKGVKQHRGEEAVAAIRRDVLRLVERRRARAEPANEPREQAAA